jgi:act minimal PKS acyl carrier protein
MSKMMSIEDLRGIFIACAGGDDTDVLHGDISAISFEELGYDSLALIETTATLKRDYGVVIPDEQITKVRTLSELLNLINDRIEV